MASLNTILLVLSGIFLSEAFITDEGCGFMKSCQYFPEDCEFSESDCRFTAWSMSDTPDSIDIEMRSATLTSQSAYMAFAFGTSIKMTNADLYYCTNSGLGSGFINAQYMQPLELPLEEGLTLEKVAVVNKTLHCRFTRPLSVSKTVGDTDRVFNVSSTEYYLLVAQGKLDADIISYHDWRAHTTEKINFVSNFEVEEGFKKIPLPPVDESNVTETTTQMSATSTPKSVSANDDKNESDPAVESTTKMLPESDKPATAKKTMLSTTAPKEDTTSGAFSSMVVASWFVLFVSMSLTQLSLA